MMIATLDDPRIPAIAWRYKDFTDAPAGVGIQKFKSSDHGAIQAELQDYYHENAKGFDQNAYARHAKIFNSMLPGS